MTAETMKSSSTHILKSILTRSAVAVLLAFFGLDAKAQQPEVIFKVLAAQGEVVTTKATEQARLAAGKSLLKDQVIQVSGKGYLGLIHKTGKSLELKEPGTYNVWELDAVVNKTASTSLTKKYAKYVFGELQREDEKGMRRNHQQYMAVTGAVSRAVASATQVKAFVPAACTVSTTLPTALYWKPLEGTNTYKVTIQDLFDAVVWSQETADTSIVLDFSKIKGLESTRTGIVRVSSVQKGPKSAIGHPVKLLPEAESRLMKVELEEFKSQQDGIEEKSALNSLSLGYYYERCGLHLNALQCFKDAALLGGEVLDYQLQYQEYLVRAGIAVE